MTTFCIAFYESYLSTPEHLAWIQYAPLPFSARGVFLIADVFQLAHLTHTQPPPFLLGFGHLVFGERGQKIHSSQKGIEQLHSMTYDSVEFTQRDRQCNPHYESKKSAHKWVWCVEAWINLEQKMPVLSVAWSILPGDFISMSSLYSKDKPFLGIFIKSG